jgi:hypothetical protein
LSSLQPWSSSRIRAGYSFGDGDGDGDVNGDVNGDPNRQSAYG